MCVKGSFSFQSDETKFIHSLNVRSIGMLLPRLVIVLVPDLEAVLLGQGHENIGFSEI